ncbi:Conserved_hypothetical protein [Hexamita inflata]|uniref:Uncharacterized protein n=1 Tax=Hexamita inflata TaxID=28002 RepID=A0AA86UUZ6_9EUKA|nr:Conserved hypothetical protein [Hexamita inflata]
MNKNIYGGHNLQKLRLQCINSQINNLTFSHRINLILEGTDFKDFGVLKSLKLSYLQLKNNQMSFPDKRTICQLTSLYQLHLDNCGFREVHLLQDLTQLRELTLKNNSLANSDFMDCEFRLLQKLDVSYNLLKSLDYLTALSPCLIELNASHNKIGQLFYSDEHDVINVEILNLSYNKLFDINQLTRFTNLKELNLQSNKLGEKRVKVLKQLQIQSLNLTSIQCRTLNCLNTKYVTIVKMHSQIKNYNTLNLFCCQILLKFNISSDILPNNLIYKLEIVKQSTQINPQFRERNGYQNKLNRYKISLFKCIKIYKYFVQSQFFKCYRENIVDFNTYNNNKKQNSDQLIYLTFTNKNFKEIT